MKSNTFSWFPWFYILLSSILITTGDLLAQVTSIGPVESWKKTDQGLEGTTSSAYFRIWVYNDHIIRLRVSLDDRMDDFSYVLAENTVPGDTDFLVKEDGNSIRLSTMAIEMEIEKTPSFRVIFRNTGGKVINEDVPGQSFFRTNDLSGLAKRWVTSTSGATPSP
jgi:hypothetical protein